MNLLPKNHEEFRQNEYWESFFKKRGKRAFEWYDLKSWFFHLNFIPKTYFSKQISSLFMFLGMESMLSFAEYYTNTSRVRSKYLSLVAETQPWVRIYSTSVTRFATLTLLQYKAIRKKLVIKSKRLFKVQIIHETLEGGRFRVVPMSPNVTWGCFLKCHFWCVFW